MAKRIGLSVPLIFIILMCTTTCLKPVSVRPGKYEHKAFRNLPSARTRGYRIRLVDSSGTPIRNKKIHLKQVRQSFMLNNREEFTNFIWLETTDRKLRGLAAKGVLQQKILSRPLAWMTWRRKIALICTWTFASPSASPQKAECLRERTLLSMNPLRHTR